MILFDAVARLVPGVLGSDQSAQEESFERHLLEYPQYTRPHIYNDMAVPDILLSGHHKKYQALEEKNRVCFALC